MNNSNNRNSIWQQCSQHSQPGYHAKLWALLVLFACLVLIDPKTTSGFGGADCPHDWLPGGPIPGIDGYVSQLIPWDRDGEGPMGTDLLVLGGSIVVDQLIPGAAIWDGTHWEGFPHPGFFVYDWAIQDGQLVVGGEAWPYGRVGRWTGTEWETLPSLNANGPVRAVEIFRGEIIAGGGEYYGNVSGNCFIRRYRGTYWDTLGLGISGHPVDALAIYNDELVAAGRFGYSGSTPLYGVASWNGAVWTSLGTGISGTNGNPITDFLLMDGYLVVGGRFTMAGGNPASNIARWDGNSWSAFSGSPGPVTAMAMHEGELYVGNWTKANGPVSESGRVRKWTGTEWVVEGDDFIGGIASLASYGGRLFAGGQFTVNGSGLPSMNLTALSIAGAGWEIIGSGLNGPIYCFSKYQDRLIAGGRFLAVSGSAMNRVAERVENAWRPLGFGMNNDVLSLEAYGDQLIAAGRFTLAGDVTASRIASWNGDSWQPLGTGLNNTVLAMTTFQDELIAGGEFTTANGIPASKIARWNGSTWNTLGTGIDYGIVRALCEYRGNLYVGGEFSGAGGVESFSIVMWDGSQWHAVPSPFGPDNPYSLSVTELAVYEDRLVAVVNNDILLEWIGAEWRFLDTEDQKDGVYIGRINKLLTRNGRLYLVGDLLGLDGQSGSLASFDGTNWSFEPGIDLRDEHEVFAISEFEGSIVLGGDFTQVNGAVSGYFAEWGPMAPSIQSQPANSSSCPGNDIALSCIADAAEEVSYQWRKDGIDLVDGPNTFGAATSELHVLSADLTDSGAYDLVITDECGVIVSDAAVVSVACCSGRPIGDSNNDGFVNALDIGQFVDAIMRDDRTASSVCPCDFTYDRRLNVDDLEGFVSALISAQ